MKFLQMNNQQAYSDWMQISSSVSVLAKKVGGIATNLLKKYP